MAIPIEVGTGKNKIQIFGLSEGSQQKLDRIAKSLDTNMKVRRYCAFLLATYAYNQLKNCEECEKLTLKQKLIKLKEKMYGPDDMSLSEMCKSIILTHLKEHQA